MNNWEPTIDHITSEFYRHFALLTTDQLNWKPDEQTWSIAQNIDHLITINKTYFPILDAVKAKTYSPPLHAKLGFLVSYFGKLILTSVNPDRKNKRKTFRMWEPSSGKIEANILEQFSVHHAELKKQIASMEEFIAQGTVIASPASKVIVYKLETAFDIIVTHEQRHLEQAKEVLNNMNLLTS